MYYVMMTGDIEKRKKNQEVQYMEYGDIWGQSAGPLRLLLVEWIYKTRLVFLL